MKILNLAVYYLITSTGFLGGISYAGDSSGGGGEYITTEKNPWFIGDEPVHYCIQRSDDEFSLSVEDAREEISAAIQSWVELVRELKPKPIKLDGEIRNLSTNFLYVRECRKDTDLKFFLGTNGPHISEVLKQRAQYTVSFAKHLDFNDQTGRAKGFVWIVPDKGSRAYRGPRKQAKEFWKDARVFRNVVLHEIGHVFGIKHQAAGVMEASFPGQIVQYSDYRSFSLKPYLFANWDEDGAAICGYPISDAAHSEAVWGVDINYYDSLCVQGDTKLGKKISLTFRGGTKLDLTFQATVINRLYRWIGNEFSIGGSYLWSVEESPNLNFPYFTNHSFVDFLPNDIIIQFMASGNPVTAEIETNPGAGLRISAISPKDAQWLELRFPTPAGR